MSDKTKVNDLCPCGSGKKYKKCCMKLQVPMQDNVIDFAWRNLRNTEGEVIDNHLMPYAANLLPQDDIPNAFSFLTLFHNLPEDALDRLFHNSFIPWYLFNCPLFYLAKSKRLLKTRLPHHRLNVLNSTIAAKYMEENERFLSSYQKKFLHAMMKSYYSIYRVEDIVKDKSITVYDMILGTRHIAKEKTATSWLKGGEFICSRIVTVDDLSIFIGLVPFSLKGLHLDLLEIKESLEQTYKKPITRDLIIEKGLDDILLHYYLAILSRVYSEYEERLNNLENTDGEKIESHKLHYKLMTTPEEAISKLLPLNFMLEYEDIIFDAELDENDKVIKATFPWLVRGNKKNSSWSNTVMGDIIITQDKLIVEVNSKERSKKIQKLLKKYLPGLISETPMTEVTSAAKLLESKDSTSHEEDMTSEMQEILL